MMLLALDYLFSSSRKSAMPVIFYVGFCVNVLYYWGVMQALVTRLGGFLNHVVGSTACESMCAAGNMLFGLEQSAVLLHPYLPYATKAELHCFMASGFASMSLVMMASYIAIGVDTRHLVTAAVLAAPSSLLFSKLLYPETEQLRMVTVRIYTHRSTDTSVLEAGAKGAMACLGVVGGIVANIVAFMAMIHFLDAVFKWAAGILGLRGVTFQTILGKAFTPLALGMGVPWKDCADVGEVIGVKVVANEFIAYTSMVDKRLDARSTMLATYALSGFGNVCSVGIMLGTLAALCPKRLPEASEVAFRALWAGCSASILSACVAGFDLPAPTEDG
ncbi:sodium/nucleoside cotransporter 2-like isoform X1 [Haemaphysalis longicornis]